MTSNNYGLPDVLLQETAQPSCEKECEQVWDRPKIDYISDLPDVQLQETALPSHEKECKQVETGQYVKNSKP